MEPSQPNPLLMEEIPQTLEQLLERIGKLFYCMTGPPRAYFEIPLAPRAKADQDGRFERLVYVTLSWRSLSKRSPAVEAQLVMAMLEPFLEARRQILEGGHEGALLFWRAPIEILEDRDPETSHGRTKIRCRVVIPGADLGPFGCQEGQLIPLV